MENSVSTSTPDTTNIFFPNVSDGIMNDIELSPLAASIEQFQDSLSFKILISTTWSLLGMLGIIGNGLVIYLGIRYKKLNDITNFYIVNLAVTDLLFVLFCIPFTTFLYMDGDWQLGAILCKLFHFMSHLSVQATCLILTAMTIYRCNLIIQNKTACQNQTLISRRRLTVIGIVFGIGIISCLICSPDLIYFTVEINVYNDTEYKRCVMDDSAAKFYVQIASVLATLTTYVIPLMIITLSYARLLSHLARNQRSLARFNTSKKVNEPKTKNEDSESHKMLSRNKSVNTARKQDSNNPLTQPAAPVKKKESKTKKVTKMVAVVTLNFGVCWLPTHLIIMIKRFGPKMEPHEDAYHILHLFKLVAHTLTYLTPVINPCLYAFFNENFRSALNQMCCSTAQPVQKPKPLNNNNMLQNKNDHNLIGQSSSPKTQPANTHHLEAV